MKKIVVILVSFLIVSCGDDSSPTGVGGNGLFFETALNTTWVYNVETKEESSFELTNIDSVVLDSHENLDGRTAYNTRTWQRDINGNQYEDLGITGIYSVDGLRLFLHRESLVPAANIDAPIGIEDIFDFEDDWFKIADDSDNSWEIINQEFTNPLFNAEGDITGNVNRISGDRIFDIEGEELRLKGFRIELEFDGTVQGSIPISFDLLTEVWVAEGIGPVIQEQFPTTINLLVQEIEIPAIRRTLINFKKGQ